MGDYELLSNHTTIEQKYESLYYLIIQTLVDGAEESETNNPIIFMYSIFTQDSNDLTCEALVASLSVYKDILDLEQLYHELKTWYVFKRTHFHNETSNLDQARTAPQEEVDDSEDESDSSQEPTQEKLLFFSNIDPFSGIKKNIYPFSKNF